MTDGEMINDENINDDILILWRNESERASIMY